jgi:hypothetical protein
MKVNTAEPGTKTSPGSRQNDMNGIDGDMMTDGKDGEKIKIPDDLPRAMLPNESTQTAFLLDWWGLFWEFFQAQRKRGNNHNVQTYLSHNQVRPNTIAWEARLALVIELTCSIDAYACP